jgi:hypothetical protein
MWRRRELTHCPVQSVVDAETANARCAIDPLSLSCMHFGWTPRPSRKLGVPFHSSCHEVSGATVPSPPLGCAYHYFQYTEN